MLRVGSSSVIGRRYYPWFCLVMIVVSVNDVESEQKMCIVHVEGRSSFAGLGCFTGLRFNATDHKTALVNVEEAHTVILLIISITLR